MTIIRRQRLEMTEILLTGTLNIRVMHEDGDIATENGEQSSVAFLWRPPVRKQTVLTSCQPHVQNKTLCKSGHVTDIKLYDKTYRIN